MTKKPKFEKLSKALKNNISRRKEAKQKEEVTKENEKITNQ